jgi:urea carboxylase
MAVFHSGHYEYQVEEVLFDMKEHNKLLRATKDEVAEIRKRQIKAQDEMLKIEQEMMERWTEEKKKNQVSQDTIESSLSGKFPNYAHFL